MESLQEITEIYKWKLTETSINAEEINLYESIINLKLMQIKQKLEQEVKHDN